MPLNVITLGQIIANHINQMITISKYLTFIKYVIEVFWDLANLGYFDPTYQMITLTMITLSSSPYI